MMSSTPVVCVVDDDKIYQFTTTRMMQLVDNHAVVLTFPDGEQALRYLQEHAHDAAALPDMMLLDINMPFMDGWQFLTAYHTLKPTLAKNVDIYMVSSSIDDRDMRRALSYEDVTDYVEKPITTDLLRSLLQRTSLPRMRPND